MAGRSTTRVVAADFSPDRICASLGSFAAAPLRAAMAPGFRGIFACVAAAWNRYSSSREVVWFIS
ncbi:MAG TPA: hypothetical protein VM802_17630 [Chitinophaga sp.]|uniref:hypothetical protein n=1 Tax=Chitinophaga sp. TaxID=1869181 RepID=UPI002BCAFC7B|nr:hypothetical protein [Chitinophaga sp.]HVI46704.1 hypothetical protein [Chitinophaga sp.]